jgi:hypothetical protein
MPRPNYFPYIREQVSVFRVEQDWKEWMDHVKTYIDEKYKTTPPIYCHTKKLIWKELLPQITEEKAKKTFEKLVLDTFHETPKEKAITRNRQRKALEKRNEEVTKFSYDYIQMISEMCQESLDPVDWLIALQLGCGCRKRDLCDKKVANFLRRAEDNERDIYQVGASKSRGKSMISVKPLFHITTTRFLKLLSEFRKLFDDGEKASTNWNDRLCTRARFYFPVKSPRSGTHVNRALYAAAQAYKNEKKNISNPRAVQIALGHGAMGTALHYLHVSIGESGFNGYLVDFQSTELGEFGIRKIPPRLSRDELERRYEIAFTTLNAQGVSPTRDAMLSLGFPSSLVSRKIGENEFGEVDFLVND